jgi:hypothetical protein
MVGHLVWTIQKLLKQDVQPLKKPDQFSNGLLV